MMQHGNSAVRVRLGALLAGLIVASCGPEAELALETTSRSAQKGTPGAENGDGDYCFNTPESQCAIGEGGCAGVSGFCLAGLECVEDVGSRFGFAPSLDICLPAHCANGVKDEDESGIDCGDASVCGSCLNACGGTAVLSASEQPGTACTVGENDGFRECTGLDSTACFADESFIYVLPSTFTMGVATTEAGYSASDRPIATPHDVTITRPFYLRGTETTVAEWKAELGSATNPSLSSCFGGGEDCPVDGVSWWSVAAWLNVKSTNDGLPECYVMPSGVTPTGSLEAGTLSYGAFRAPGFNTDDGSPLSCEGYRLPTEAEWEMAARAGTETMVHDGDITQFTFPCEIISADPVLEPIGFYACNSGGEKFPVGSRSSNTWGFFDMMGNVQEWTGDIRTDFTSAPAVDPTGGVANGSSTGSYFVWKGGGFTSPARRVKHGFREAQNIASRFRYTGFRIARSAAERESDGNCLVDAQCPGEWCDEFGECNEQLDLGEICDRNAMCKSGNCSLGICAPQSYSFIQGGTFLIGSPEDEPGRVFFGSVPTETQRSRTVSSFFLKRTEITQSEWAASGFTNPSLNKTCGASCPVERVNWWETLYFANWRSQEESVTACYTVSGCNTTAIGAGRVCTDVALQGGASLPVDCDGYRLPTEAEWERAYRADTTTAFYNGPITEPTGDDPNLNLIGWYVQNSDSNKRQVSGKAANAWGLRDMAGNVYEWVWDWRTRDNNPTSVENYAGPSSSALGRTFRGGAFSAAATQSRAAFRSSQGPNTRSSTTGFRLARTAP